jgi:hypothetical protein
MRTRTGFVWIEGQVFGGNHLEKAQIMTKIIQFGPEMTETIFP